MSLYLVSYDLHKQRDYARLIKALEGSGAVRILESTWLAVYPGPASTIRDNLKATVDADDSIVVIQLKSDAQWASVNGRPAGVKWLQQHFTP